ncbi:disease resistance protein RPV1-like [Syzygium oleosum]|uniref:disease resistance protein RPV1-like n=1 Tax=Syzygium oleosum TaxID=219896 RepID=UPI0024B95E87|nr:disease resistance protein RPV1-like [Syzygium oleosum]
MEKGTNSQVSSGSSYEVFLSFRGADTRYEFTDHLYHGMVEAGIIVFRDNESLHVGKEIGGELLRAIENSKIYIPIFSENYASSDWCLRELAYMVECTSKSNGNKEILPIFLNVEPADVKLKTYLYKQPLSKRKKTGCAEAESWEKALVEVGKKKGWNWQKDQGQVDLIQSVKQTVLTKLNIGFKKNVTEHLVGVDDRVEDIIKMLHVESDSVQFLGIHGMGGIGKTTLAKVIFNRLSSHFRVCNFLSDIGESSRRHGLVHLQKQLLSKFLDSHSNLDQIHDVDDGIDMIKRVFRNKKVFIVLDDVDEKEQLKRLAEKGNWFGSGSRIIITTRDQSVLMIEGEATDEGPVKKFANVWTYEAHAMEFDHALKLFSRHAFRRDSPPYHYVSLSKAIVSTLGKLPLALEIIGSSLSGKSKKIWVDTLKKLEEAPPMGVQKKLMVSYERLDHAQKQVFMDIACFFVGWDKTYPLYMWDECGYHPHDSLEVLSLMSLIKIKGNNTFWMHDQVRDLGREIVRQENFNDPRERSRVWNHKEALSILQLKEGSRKIEALSAGYHGNEDVILKHDEFANLRNLRFFQGDRVLFVGDFNNLLFNLKWISWQSCPPKFEATNFHPTNLVVLDLSRSHISEEWIGWNQIKEARKLKVLNLSYCKSLKRTPDLSTWVSLEILVFEGCSNLIEINPSVGKLKLLTSLNLGGCQFLQELPKEIGSLQALTEIVMPKMLHELPETFGNLQSLLTLDVADRNINKLPYSIGGLVKLTRLNLSSIYIKELPDSVGKLQSLVELDLSRTRICHLPDSIGNLKQLKVLRMRDIEGITKLPSAIGLVEKLEELDAHECCNLTGEIPEEIGRLSCLRILDLSNTCISGLPTTMSHLSNLQILKLEICPELKQLPELPPSLTWLIWSSFYFGYSSLIAHGVSTRIGSLSQQGPLVATLPTSIGTQSHLKTLSLSCKYVQFLPRLPSSLRELRLQDLATTRSLDFSNLKNLSFLAFYECSLEFSSIFDAESEELRMECCELRKLDSPSQSEMKSLRLLKMVDCEFLPEVLDLSRMKNLREVRLIGCRSLVEIRGLEELGSLRSLSVICCPSMERMSGLSKLKELRKLEIRCILRRVAATPTPASASTMIASESLIGADGGKNPTFQEKFVFTLVEGQRELNLAVWNGNILTLGMTLLYLRGCRFLPKLNNALVDDTNSAYKERFASLQNLVLIMFEQDTVLIPKETSWFGYYPDGTFDTGLPPQETELYTKVWIGLTTLIARKVKFIDVSRNHLLISLADMQNYIVPYSVHDASLAKNMATGMASCSWSPWVQGLYRRMVTLSEDWLVDQING